MDEAKYQSYSPPFYSAGNFLVYGAFFAIYPFSIIYIFVTDWDFIRYSFVDLYKSIVNWKRGHFEGHEDAHSKMMSKYKEVPDWCFLIVLVISFVLAIVCVKKYPTNTPAWTIVFALGINFVFLIPITIIAAVTGWGFELNVLVELIIGYALPGNGTALMIIKAIGYNIDGQAQNYISDQKMAHYAKVPPRSIFRGQLIAVLLQCLVCIGVMNWQIANTVDLCQPLQKQKFTCPGVTTFFSVSVFWGVIGPKRVFRGLYSILQWCFLIGALLPIPCILAKHYFKKYSVIRYFNLALIIGGLLIYAPYNLSYYTPGLYVSFVFMYYIKRHHLAWWEKYNYVLASALDAGVAFSSVIIFFAVVYHDKSINW